MDSERLRESVRRVRERLAAACARAGRPADAARLVAVTKYVPEAVVAQLLACGVRDLGENQVQQLAARAERLGSAARGLDDEGPGTPRWHMIGHLQRNKVRALLPVCRIVHSVDSERLLEELRRRAETLDATVDVLLEVNVAGEASKQGIAPAAAPRLAEAAGRCGRLRVRGLMTMAPLNPDPEAARPHFAALRGLLEALRRSGAVGPECRELSMGMSQDFEVAAEEGATLVRVGSVLFEGVGERDAR